MQELVNFELEAYLEAPSSHDQILHSQTRTLNKYYCEADTMQARGPAAPLRGEMEEGTPHQVNTHFVLQRAALPGLMGSLKWCFILLLTVFLII